MCYSYLSIFNNTNLQEGVAVHQSAKKNYFCCSQKNYTLCQLCIPTLTPFALFYFDLGLNSQLIAERMHSTYFDNEILGWSNYGDLKIHIKF